MASLHGKPEGISRMKMEKSDILRIWKADVKKNHADTPGIRRRFLRLRGRDNQLEEPLLKTLRKYNPALADKLHQELDSGPFLIFGDI